MGCHQAIFETDSRVLKQAISSQDYDLAPLGALFQKIKFQMRVGFDNVNLYVCPMSCNNPAHALAAHGNSLGNDNYEIWLGQFPNVVMNSVAGDLPSSLNVMEYHFFHFKKNKLECLVAQEQTRTWYQKFVELRKHKIKQAQKEKHKNATACSLKSYKILFVLKFV